MTPEIAIVDSNTLSCLGLQNLLEEIIPTAIILAILCNSASFLTHYGCGVTPIFFGTGFMGQGEWWKIGFVITVMHIVVWMALGLPIMGVLGMM